MHSSRTSTALRQLSGLGREPQPADWRWAVVTPDRVGRLTLPTAACAALGTGGDAAMRVAGVCHRDALVLRRDGDTRPITIDRRGRMYLPVAMRTAATSMLVGGRANDGVVVIVPTSVLERLGDVLVGDPR